nr:ABC transporter permease subunit [Paenibacillus sp. J31TS4]
MEGIRRKRRKARLAIWQNYELYLFLLPTLVYFLVFHYMPMYGVQIAFKRFIAVKGINGSPWVGFEHFERFFESFQFLIVLKNTLAISLYELLVAFPAPIVLALLLNQLTSERFKKLAQTVTYAPHFISVVVVVGMLYLFLSPKIGLVNRLLVSLGFEPVYFMASSAWFSTIFVFSGIWQNIGWSTIIYLAALAGVNPDLHEAAVMDGATKRQRIQHIDFPSILPTIMILLILNIGHLMSVGFEKVYLMQNQLNIDASEVIQTYVYKAGLLEGQLSYSAAIGLFNSVINFTLLLAFNQLARKSKQASLW